MYLPNCDVTILLVPRDIWIVIVLDFINLFLSLLYSQQEHYKNSFRTVRLWVL